MEPGKKTKLQIAIEELYTQSTTEIRLHLSHRWWETDPLKRAMSLFHRYQMHRSERRNSILYYLNLRKKKFAIIPDEGALKTLGPRYWEDLAQHLSSDLKSTHYENALVLSLNMLGAALAEHYPKVERVENPASSPDQ